MITLDHITREICHIIGCQLKLDFKTSITVKTTQTHVDFILDNKELSQIIDDLSEKILAPAANALIDRLNIGNALCCYELPKPNVKEWSRYLYNGCSIRGIVNREYHDTVNNKIVNLFRFDILWS